MGDEVIGKLQAMCHETIAIPALSALAGQAGVIRLSEDGWIDGAHDPRSDGCAIGM